MLTEIGQTKEFTGRMVVMKEEILTSLPSLPFSPVGPLGPSGPAGPGGPCSDLSG